VPGGRRIVGRTRELAAIRGIFARAANRPVAALLVGEAGMGKTRLLREVAPAAGARHCLRLTGFEPEQQVPLAAAADLLRALRLGPVAAGRTGEPIEPLQLFEAAHLALAGRGPALLVLDDLQWADEMSVALCHYLVRAAVAEMQDVVLVCAARPGPRAAGFGKALRDLLPDDDVVEIDLGPLDAAAAVELATQIDPALGEDGALRLYELTRGSPFWIDALARRGGTAGDHDTVIAEQLRGMSADAAECLAALVVAGRPVPPDGVAAVLGWPPARSEHAVALLVNQGLVTQDGPSLRISHDLIREAARHRLSEGDRNRLHRRVAAWLAADPEAELPRLMEALEHQHAAGTPSAALGLRAVRSPRRRLIGRDGVMRLAAIADAVDDAADPDGPELAGAVARLLGEIGERAAALERWTALADQLPSGDERAGAALEAARQAIDLRRSEQARRLLEQARAAGGTQQWVAIEADALDLARRAWVDGDREGAQARLGGVVARARAAVAAGGDIDMRTRRAYVEVLTAERDAALTSDDVPRLLRISQERVDATRGLGEEHLIALADAATSLWYVNGFAECATRLSRVIAEARAQHRPGLIAEVCHSLAFTQYHLGALREAAALLDEAQQLEERLPATTRRAVPWVRGGTGHVVRASLHDWPAAVRGLQAEIAASPDPHNLLRTREQAAICVARFAGAAGRDEVEREVAATDADVAAAGCARCGAEALLVTAEALARVGNPAAAGERLARWDAGHPSPEPYAALGRLRSVVAIGAARRDEAATPLARQLAEQSRETEQRVTQLWALVDLGTLHAGRDDAAAVEAWTSAHALALSMGARSEADLLQRRLRGVGVRRASGPAADTALLGLTSRELDVARLVSAGARNAEVAATLFLSPKTVERHLSNVFAKLQVRNRAELVARYAAALREAG
jgi:DNA-binding NarL/FixJ family response regulator